MQVAAVPLISVILTPERFSQASVSDLLTAASLGHISFDQRLLHAILDRPDRGVPELVAWALADHDEVRISLDDELINIFRYLKVPEAVPFFIHYIREAPEEISDEALEALIPLRDHALEPLLKLYEEVGEESGGEIAFLLAAFRKRDPRVLQVLLDRLEYDACDGAIAIGMYGDPAAKPALEKMLAELPEDEHDVRRDLTEAIDLIEDQPAHPDPEPYDIWSDYPESLPPVFNALDPGELTQMLASPVPAYRAGAARALAEQDLNPELRKRVFELAKTDPDPMVRGECWAALLSELEDPRIYKALVDCLHNESAPLVERVGALIGVASRSVQDGIRSRMVEFYNIPEVRAKALTAMWHSFDRTLGDYFPPHLNDPDPDVRTQAILGVGYLGVTSSAESLRPLFEEEEYRETALLAYALCVRTEMSRGRVRGLLKKIEEAAGGFSFGEAEIVKTALDQRLLLHGQEPVFYHEDGEEMLDAEPAGGATAKTGRNDACPCGSGKKFKKCCGSPA